MPLYNFIKALTTNNLKWLLSDKDNWKLKPDLEEAWEKVFMDYTERLNDPASQKTFQIIKTIRILTNQLFIAEAAIELLMRVDDLKEYQPTITQLKALTGYYGKFTENTIVKDIKQCISRLKLKKMQLNQAIEEYRKISSSEEEKAKEADFTAQIVMFEQVFGIPIDIRNISVAKYISYLSAYKSKVKDG